MKKFLCVHTFPVGAYTYEQICQLASAAQRETDVRGYRSFFNLTEGKAWCLVEAENRESVVAWFDKMGIAYDEIHLVEIEGERGLMEDLRLEAVHAGVA